MLRVFVCSLIIGLSFPVYAVTPVKYENVTIEELITQTKIAQQKVEVTQLSKKEKKKYNRVNRKLSKLEHKLQKRKKKRKSAIDLRDPVEKWKWYWILGWGAAIALVVTAAVLGLVTTGVLYRLLIITASLAGIFGTISLVMWLIRMNS